MSRGQEFSLSVSLFGGFEIHAIVVLRAIALRPSE